MNHRLLVTMSVLAVLGGISLAQAPPGDAEKLPPGALLTRLEVTPRSVELTNPFHYRQVLVTGILQTGERVDLTRLAVPKNAAAQKVASYSPRGQVRPLADGAA